jgi:hypothetical protein
VRTVSRFHTFGFSLKEVLVHEHLSVEVMGALDAYPAIFLDPASKEVVADALDPRRDVLGLHVRKSTSPEEAEKALDLRVE